jgi:sulfite reductase (NADPH) hemoprotein beta-component
MYKYDQYDQAIVDARVAEFSDQVRRRLAGDITEDQFKPLRLMNGLYLQLHAYMLRVAIPYGTLDSRQMRMLAHIARKYDRDYGHFTTRQNIQYNWIKLEDAPAILADLASVEMHAMQGLRQTKSPIPALGRSCCANGLPSTRNSAICRVSLKSR